jgi:hypothetical protein
MLHQRLFELAIATAFAGQNVLNTLLSELRQPSPSSLGAMRKRCLGALADDLDRDHGRRFRHTDLVSVCERVWPPATPKGSFPVMSHIFTKLMLRDGTRLHYQAKAAEDYVQFAGRFDPACLAGWHIASEIHSGAITVPEAVLDIVDAQQPFFSAPTIDEERYTDGHVHINGVNLASVILMNQIWPRFSQVTEETQSIATLAAVAHTLLLAPRLDLGLGRESYAGASGEIRLRELIAPLIANDAPLGSGIVEWPWLRDQGPAANELGWYFLRRQIGESLLKHDLSYAWLWFQVFLWWQYLHPKCTPTLRTVIHYLLGGLMQLRRKVIMEGVGLARFKQVNGDWLRNSAGRANGVPNARTMLQGKADCAEIKVGPDFFTPEKIRGFLDNLCYARGIGLQILGGDARAPDVHSYRKIADQWHLCVHFSRNRKDYGASRREALWKSADALLVGLAAPKGWPLRDPLASYSDGVTLVPGNWVRGFDVVGDENEARIEVYAPVLRWLRADAAQNGGSRAGLLSASPRVTTPRYLSIHAGEDYAHPLSGMRHIDETIIFCEMRPGDRLGHALAIGIDPVLWCERQGDMLLAAPEHLDNLVWAWHHASVLANTRPTEVTPEVATLAGRVLPLLAKRIDAIVRHVPWARGNPGDESRARILYGAWRYRNNCPYLFKGYAPSQLDDIRIRVAVPDRRKLLSGKNAGKSQFISAEQVYWRRANDDLQNHGRDVLVMMRPGNPREEPYDENLKLVIDHDSEDELAFMHVLQDYLLEKIRKAGLIIETNPTSNVYIARLNGYHEHPIFRWAPPDPDLLAPGAKYNVHGLRQGPVAVTINTDDPGIMPTTLRTEFALLADAGRHQQPGDHVDDWIDNLRLHGNARFEQNHVSVWHQPGVRR